MIYLILSILALGVFAFLISLIKRTKNEDDQENIIFKESPEGCCGQHMICERDSLIASFGEQIVYYDDEELDIYKNRDPQSYSEDEILAFEDVLNTMKQSDIPGWTRSLTLRQIQLPLPLREEVLLLVNDLRERRNTNKYSV